jgi:hypothetical protein
MEENNCIEEHMNLLHHLGAVIFVLLHSLEVLRVSEMQKFIEDSYLNIFQERLCCGGNNP